MTQTSINAEIQRLGDNIIARCTGNGSNDLESSLQRLLFVYISIETVLERIALEIEKAASTIDMLTNVKGDN